MPRFQSPVHSDLPFLHDLFLYYARILSNPTPERKKIHKQLIIRNLKFNLNFLKQKTLSK